MEGWYDMIEKLMRRDVSANMGKVEGREMQRLIHHHNIVLVHKKRPNNLKRPKNIFRD